MSEQAESLGSLVDKVISDIHLKTIRSSHSFDDIYAKLGAYRNLTNVILCTVLLVILMCLIIALCCGCFAKRRRGYRDDCCNKSTGATTLLIAMLLIFLTFSIIALIGIFYFVFGLLAYHGACAPLRDTTSNNIFNRFDSFIDFHMLPPPAKTGYLGEDSTENPLPPIRLSTALNACRSNESIIDVLQMNHFFSIRNLELLRIVKELNDQSNEIPKIEDTLKEMRLISDEDMIELYKMRDSNLSTYHSQMYTREMCNGIPQYYDLTTEIGNLVHYTIKYSKSQYGYRCINLELKEFHNVLLRTLKDLIKEIRVKADAIDKLILYKGLNFNDSINLLLEEIKQSERFIQTRGLELVHEIVANISASVAKEVSDYKDYVIHETKYHVGRCGPLAYIYEQGVDIVCNQMVDPMNGFWMGVLLCCLLFLPILWVAHRLQCLYKKIGIYVAPVATGGCPECTGRRGPIIPATVMVCSGGLGNKSCPCPTLKKNVPKSGDCVCSSQATKTPRSLQAKSGQNNENVETLSEGGDFFDVEAQQIFVFPGSSQTFPKKKID